MYACVCVCVCVYLSVSVLQSNRQPVRLNLLTCQVKPGGDDKKCFDLISCEQAACIHSFLKARVGNRVGNLHSFKLGQAIVGNQPSFKLEQETNQSQLRSCATSARAECTQVARQLGRQTDGPSNYFIAAEKTDWPGLLQGLGHPQIADIYLYSFRTFN